VVHIDDTISAGELAKSMGIKANEVIERLIALGTMATINEQIDVATATVIAG
jgi:translation initiation factor IF-2